MVAAVVLPFFLNVASSFYAINPFEKVSRFVGFGNFVLLASDDSFKLAVSVTVRYALASAVLCALVSVAVAALVPDLTTLRRVAPVLCLPLFLPSVAVAAAFSLFLDSQLGIPAIFSALTGETYSVLGDPERTFWAATLLDVWQWAGGAAIAVAYARLASGQALRDSLRVAGAPGFVVFRETALPSTTKAVVAVFLFRLVWNLGDAERINALTSGGGPFASARVMGIWLDRALFDYGDLGYTAAAATLFYAVAAAASAVLVWVATHVRNGEDRSRA